MFKNCGGYVFVTLLFVFVLMHNVSSRMTDKQVAAAVKLMKNMCLGKSKTTPEEVEKMHKGNWDVDHNTKCYMYCCLNVYHLLDKDNNFDKNALDAQLNQLPEHMLEHVTGSLSNCEHAATHLDDKCVAAWEYSKCIYDYNPEKYFLP